MLKSPFLDDQSLTTTTERPGARQRVAPSGSVAALTLNFDELLNSGRSAIVAEPKPTREIGQTVFVSWHAGAELDISALMPLSANWGAVRTTTNAFVSFDLHDRLKPPAGSRESRLDRISGILLRDEGIDLLTRLSTSTSVAEDDEIIRGFARTSARALHAFADLVSEDAIELRDGQLALAKVTHKVIDQLERVAQRRASRS